MFVWEAVWPVHLRIFLSLPPQRWDYRQDRSTPGFSVLLGMELRPFLPFFLWEAHCLACRQPDRLESVLSRSLSWSNHLPGAGLISHPSLPSGSAWRSLANLVSFRDSVKLVWVVYLPFKEPQDGMFQSWSKLFDLPPTLTFFLPFLPKWTQSLGVGDHDVHLWLRNSSSQLFLGAQEALWLGADDKWV